MERQFRREGDQTYNFSGGKEMKRQLLRREDDEKENYSYVKVEGKTLIQEDRW